MSFDIGIYGIALSALLAGIQGTFLLLPTLSKRPLGAALIATCAVAQSLIMTATLMRLMYLYLISDLSLINVALNSQTNLPLLYKISGLWSNHEGSWLLWLFLLSAVGGIFALFHGPCSPFFRVQVLATHGLTSLGFYLFLLCTSNPFVRLTTKSLSAQGLNPLLDDISLGFHPPILYGGYAGFAIVFALAITVLRTSNSNLKWTLIIRPWTLASWVFLTVGLAWGSWWAYYELGWGGWWFWDPVENAALMPWLLSTALIHCLLVTQHHGKLKNWTLFLAITTYLLCLIGTVLVRSGLVTTVHAFAIDHNRGLFLTILVALIIFSSYCLFGFKATKKTSAPLQLFSLEGTILLNTMVLFGITIIILFATLYPIGLESLTGERIAVGPPYFNTLLVPLSIPWIIIMGIAAYLSWHSQNANQLRKKLLLPITITMAVVLLVWIYCSKFPLMALVASAAAIWLITTTVLGWWQKIYVHKLPIRFSTTHGMLIAHLGLAVTILGMTSDVFWQAREEIQAKPGSKIKIAGKYVNFVDIYKTNAPHYLALNARFTIEGGKADDFAIAQRRLYSQQKVVTTKTGLLRDGFSHVYISLGEFLENGYWQISLTWHPLVTLIWLGGLIMAAGGFISFLGLRRKAAAQ